MSWLSHVADALEKYSNPEVAMSNPMEKLVVSRAKTVRTLEGEIAAYESQIAGLAVGKPARVALESVVAVKRQRLVKTLVELEGFRELLKDPRQVELGASKKPLK